MPKVVIYTTPFCPYCLMAKRLLAQEGRGIRGNRRLGRLGRCATSWSPRSGGRMTVPQIWIGDTHVGGSDELHALERDGKLDALLAG